MKKYKQINDKVELCIPPELEPELKKVFEIEMEQGFCGVLEDGRKHYVFQVSASKALLLQSVFGTSSLQGEKSHN